MYLVQQGAGFSRGAPACVDQPKHKVDPQTSPVPYSLNLREAEEGGGWILTVGSKAEDAPEFKGILLQSQQSGKLSSVGANKMFKKVKRGCKDLPTLTHTNRWSGEEDTDRRFVEFQFTAAEGATQEPSFNIHIVQSYSMFWTNILVTPTTGGVAAAEETTEAA